jgi:hypothetical protein
MKLIDLVKRINAKGMEAQLYARDSDVWVFAHVPSYYSIQYSRNFQSASTGICFHLKGGRTSKWLTVEKIDAKLNGPIPELMHKTDSDEWDATWQAEYKAKKAIRDWTLIDTTTELSAA